MHICSYKRSFLSQALYKVWCLSKLYVQEIFVENNLWAKKATAQIGPNVKARVFHAWLLARSQFALGRSRDRPIRSRFSVVFLGPRANAELVPKFHVTLMLHMRPFQWWQQKFRLTLTSLWLRAGPPCSRGIWVRGPGPTGWGGGSQMRQ
jgi:hypothetical protein